MIDIAADGACKGNPGPGGWGFAVSDSDDIFYSANGGEISTTNNRMEMMAFIKAIEFIQGCNYHNEEEFTLLIDSQYVIKGCTEWMAGWKNKNFAGVKNSDLWSRIVDLEHVWYNMKFVWIKGHSGHVLNERADQEANAGVARIKALNGVS